MNYLLKHLKPIAYFLASLILLQSCVIYNNKPSALEEVPDQDNPRIKIETLDGKKYKLYWIEEKEGNIVSIINTKRQFIDTTKIQKYVLIGERDRGQVHYHSQVHFKEAVNREEFLKVKTKKRTYKFMKIELLDHQIIGYVKKGPNPHSVDIPIDQIKGFYLYNQTRSDWGDVLIITGVVAGVLIGFMFYHLSKDDWITLGN
jgi:hypothetical protein